MRPNSQVYNQPVGDPAVIACAHCDLLQRLPNIEPGESVRCARCDEELWRRREDSLNRTLALGGRGRGALRGRELGSNARPYGCRPPGIDHRNWRCSAPVGGRAGDGCGAGAFDRGDRSGAADLLLAIVLGARRVPAPRWVGVLLRHHAATRTWSMIEVMMLGVLVALIKIADYATVIPGLALFVLGSLVFLLAWMQSSFDSREVWDRIQWAEAGEPRGAGTMAEARS
jgi:paraquat-inducible protein A